MNPGDTAAAARSVAVMSMSLNQGRGVNPGDTRSAVSFAPLSRGSAQPRPGREPRRHPYSQSLNEYLSDRSTKAGA